MATRRNLAVLLMVGATILVAGNTSASRGPFPVRRFLAVATNNEKSLITIVARQEILDQMSVPLRAGTRVRLVGVPHGHTIEANRIDILD
ncbi:MAG: hypothetical protein M0Z53_06735 [Thermaerobacter sp.]|nr:hypothetical protein [Thermaerobacter sp.]